MTKWAGPIMALLLAAAPAARLASRERQRPQFQGAVDLVTVDVSVHRGNLAVPGLTTADFELTDNGVAQHIEAVSGDSLPIDLTVVVDASGSVQSMMTQLRTDIQEAASILRADDRLRLIAFTDAIAELAPFQSPADELPLWRIPVGGWTSVFDALAAAMMRTRTPDRHELIVAFTDGADTSSTLSDKTLLDVARRSDAILHVFIVHRADESSGAFSIPSGPVGSGAAFGVPWHPFRPRGAAVDREWLDASADTTGGELQDIVGEAHIPGGLKTAVADMRTSYILRYTARGVARPGWHEIKVKLVRPGDYSVRARQGYIQN